MNIMESFDGMAAIEYVGTRNEEAVYIVCATLNNVNGAMKVKSGDLVTLHTSTNERRIMIVKEAEIKEIMDEEVSECLLFRVR